MTGLIKAGHADREARAFDAPRSADRIVAPRSLIELALGEAREEIARLQSELIAQRHTAKRQKEAAYETGLGDGQLAAETGAAQRLEHLAAALEGARADWDRRLTDIDTLAVQLARATLAKLFADSDDLGDLVARAISRKLEAIRDESVVAISVSGRDFADPAELDALRARIPDAGYAVLIDGALKSGGCRIDLKLGHIDLGVETLAREIDGVLAVLAQDGQCA